MNASERSHIGTSAVTQQAHPTEQQEDVLISYNLRLLPRARVRFDDGVIDNEHLGRRKSKKCCQFHKKREFGESSSESGEDTSEDDNGESAEDKGAKICDCDRLHSPRQKKA